MVSTPEHYCFHRDEADAPPGGEVYQAGRRLGQIRDSGDYY